MREIFLRHYEHPIQLSSQTITQPKTLGCRQNIRDTNMKEGFLCQMKTLPICANSETLESPQFLYWRGEKMSFIIMWKFENHEINDFT